MLSKNDKLALPTSGLAWTACLCGAKEVSQWNPAHLTPLQTGWSHSTALGPVALGLKHTHTVMKITSGWVKSGWKNHLLALQIHMAVGGFPWKIDSCHFPKMEYTTFPFASVTTPSISFTEELHEFALKKKRIKKKNKHIFRLKYRITENSTDKTLDLIFKIIK